MANIFYWNIIDYGSSKIDYNVFFSIIDYDYGIVDYGGLYHWVIIYGLRLIDYESNMSKTFPNYGLLLSLLKNVLFLAFSKMSFLWILMIDLLCRDVMCSF